MTHPQAATTRGDVSGLMLSAFGAMGVTIALLTLRRSKPRADRRASDKRAALATYLRDHLAGADAAIRIVEQLSDAYRGTPEGTLFGSLHDQFREDRAVVEAVVVDLGATDRSIKRLAGRATGNALKLLAGGAPGELSLFRTLEALAIGVQGKRCLWRAAQALAPPRQAPGRRSFVELEADAVRQWEAIERCRCSLVPRTLTL